MLARYHIVRGARPPGDPLPEGVRQDTRKHTRHVLRPERESVLELLRDLDDPSASGRAFERFRKQYGDTLKRRFHDDRAPFDAIAELSRRTDVFLGCNCPTAHQPDVEHCHTTLALHFFAKKYPDLSIRLPRTAAAARPAETSSRNRTATKRTRKPTRE